MSEELSYKDAMEELEAIVNTIEHEEPEPDALIGLVERAGFLMKYCKAKLRSTEDELEKTLKKLNGEE
ncbi:hypothetical protein FUAX_15720 [Fulvitalea axinellae]|uniref:Exodeoxyribonuclease VII small subunit n=1 Tax=Fulvitalea axinellae TaxID=1182444 RepID=A0AAU9CIN0_9BACT|nr:hypothetical protein FUAX_15720 [Fulvitalea axinellae]